MICKNCKTETETNFELCEDCCDHEIYSYDQLDRKTYCEGCGKERFYNYDE